MPGPRATHGVAPTEDILMKLVVTVDHSKCVGNGTCLTIATHVFEHNWDRQSVVIDPNGDPPELVLEAAETLSRERHQREGCRDRRGVVLV